MEKGRGDWQRIDEAYNTDTEVLVLPIIMLNKH